jgi:hypothetical protein
VQRQACEGQVKKGCLEGLRWNSASVFLERVLHPLSSAKSALAQRSLVCYMNVFAGRAAACRALSGAAQPHCWCCWAFRKVNHTLINRHVRFCCSYSPTEMYKV